MPWQERVFFFLYCLNKFFESDCNDNHEGKKKTNLTATIAKWAKCIGYFFFVVLRRRRCCCCFVCLESKFSHNDVNNSRNLVDNKNEQVNKWKNEPNDSNKSSARVRGRARSAANIYLRRGVNIFISLFLYFSTRLFFYRVFS